MNINKDSADLSAAFKALRIRFEQGLAQRAALMLENFDQSPPDSSTLLAKVITESHKLAGACGTFGFAALGSRARQIEQMAVELQSKSAKAQLLALPELKRALLEFELAVAAALQGNKSEFNTDTLTNQKANTIWLLLDDKKLVSELTTQLTAFGHQVQHFTDFDSCNRRLRDEAPAILFSAIRLAGSGVLFEQTLLLNQIVKTQTRLMVFSEIDNFELRIKAAQQRAEAFFVSPLDVPNMITAISAVLDSSAAKAGRVFIVDDDRLLAEHYALVLNAAGIDTQIIVNIRNIVGEITRFQPDLVIMDMYMPDYSGAEVAGLLRQYQALKRLPIVFLSSEMNKSLQIRAMSHGADDFITKPIEDAQLAASVKVRLARSIQIKNLIEKDSLTSLIKHSAIKEVAGLELERAQRTGKPLSVVMLDIDHFKAVNDNYGHAIGDLVIAALATLLRKRIRKTDRAGRYGGEEFMLVLPECTAEQARVLTMQILQTFAQLSFTAATKHFTCTFSAGVACSEDTGLSSAEQVIASADAALYRAKAAGRNQVC